MQSRQIPSFEDTRGYGVGTILEDTCSSSSLPLTLAIAPLMLLIDSSASQCPNTLTISQLFNDNFGYFPSTIQPERSSKWWQTFDLAPRGPILREKHPIESRSPRSCTDSSHTDRWTFQPDETSVECNPWHESDSPTLSHAYASQTTFFVHICCRFSPYSTTS